MTGRYILGVDGGIATFGIAVVRVGQHPDVDRVEWLTVVRTQPSAKKLRIHTADDNTRRLREINERLHTVARTHAPSMLAVEQFSAVRSASASAKMAMAWTLVVAIADEYRVPLVNISPQEAKKGVTGSKSASKSAVQRAVKAHYGDDSWQAFEMFESTAPKGMWEHGYDAAAVATVALQTDLGRLLRS